jgi:hypothetical protein
MDAPAKVTTGMTAEKAVTVTAEMTVAHYEHARGLWHADDDPAYGNGLRPRICRRASSASAWT